MLLLEAGNSENEIRWSLKFELVNRYAWGIILGRVRCISTAYKRHLTLCIDARRLQITAVRHINSC